MPLAHRRTLRLALVLVAMSVALVATVAAVAGARDPGSLRAGIVELQDDGPRNPEAEMATGDTDAMLAVVQDIVDCLRRKGFHPGDPQVRGENVAISGWDPVWDSAAWRADEECAFPAR